MLARIVSRSVTTSPPAPPLRQLAARSPSNRRNHRHHRSLLTAERERGREGVAYACTHTPAAPLASAEHTSPDPHFDSWHGIPNPPHASPSLARGTHCFASEHGTAPGAGMHRATAPSRAHVVPNAQQPGSASHRSPGFTRLRHSRTAGAAVAGAVPGRHIVYAGSHHVPSAQHVACDPAHRCHAGTRDVHTTAAGGDAVSAGTHCAYHWLCTSHRDPPSQQCSCWWQLPHTRTKCPHAGGAGGDGVAGARTHCEYHGPRTAHTSPSRQHPASAPVHVPQLLTLCPFGSGHVSSTGVAVGAAVAAFTGTHCAYHGLCTLHSAPAAQHPTFPWQLPHSCTAAPHPAGSSFGSGVGPAAISCLQNASAPQSLSLTHAPCAVPAHAEAARATSMWRAGIVVGVVLRRISAGWDEKRLWQRRKQHERGWTHT